jgi:magnesium chelatase family protein
MTLAVARSRALDGLASPEVAVEVHLANGLPGFTLVGLPEAEVRESRERVRAALTTCGFEFPARRITVNLAPADLPKDSGRFDLPIALGILAASGQLPPAALDGYEFAGELSLSGELRAVHGALPMSLGAAGSGRPFVLPSASAGEAALCRRTRVLAADTLLQVYAHLRGEGTLNEAPPIRTASERAIADLAEVRGQAPAKRALEIAAAGGHSLLMSGPPGTGKSMLAQRLPGILPPPDEEQALATATIHSVAGLGFDPSRWRERPFRAPHHTASAVALVGGGALARPGEISLADGGVLFLDELPEFDRKVLEVLREPLESGSVHIARASRRATFPARFQLVAAMNPCPCGHLGDSAGRCRCTPDQVARYRARISGPLLDRIDLHVDVPAMRADEMLAAPSGDSSVVVRARVATAQARQQARQRCLNACLPPAAVDRHCALDADAGKLLASAITRLSLSTRAHHRVLRLARSIADLAGEDAIARSHVAEAIQYRRQLAGWQT